MPEKIKNFKINLKKINIKLDKKNNTKIKLDETRDKKEIFIRNIDNYKIYKMEEVYFAFPADQNVNFDEEDYALNED